jgi:hypothetical protein
MLDHGVNYADALGVDLQTGGSLFCKLKISSNSLQMSPYQTCRLLEPELPFLPFHMAPYLYRYLCPLRLRLRSKA